MPVYITGIAYFMFQKHKSHKRSRRFPFSIYLTTELKMTQLPISLLSKHKLYRFSL